MIDFISAMMWYGLGFLALVQIEKIIEKHYGKCIPVYMFLPTVFFIAYGAVSAVLAILMWLSFEWDGKLPRRS